MKCVLCLAATAALGLGSLGFSAFTPRALTAATAEVETCVVTCTTDDGTTCQVTLEKRGDECVVVSCEPIDGKGECSKPCTPMPCAR